MLPSTLKTSAQSEPLVPAETTNHQVPSEPSTLSPTAFHTVKTLAVLRVGLGVASLFAPRFTFGLFKFPIPIEMTSMARLFGIREIALGELLYTADDATLPDRGKREIRRSLWANVGCDAVDICSVAFAVSRGHMGRLPGALLAGGAAMGIGMEVLGLKTV